MMKLPKSVWFAALGACVAGVYLWTHAFKVPAQEPVRLVSTSPYESSAAGIGLIEARNEAVRVTPFFSGRVAEVLVEEGQVVQPGDALFKLDTQQLQAAVQRQKRELQATQATIHRLQQQPRPDSLPPLQAAVQSAQATYNKEKQRYDRFASVSNVAAVSDNDLTTAKLQMDEAFFKLREAKAKLALQQAGTWAAELKETIAQADVVRARLQELSVQLKQSTVTSPIAGAVLQVNIRPGEYVSATQAGDSLGAREDAPVIVGDTEHLQVKVDIDEVTASQIQPGQTATGYIKGNPKLSFPLTFKRLNPLMVPKRSLTGGTAERVDIRVLQVIYDFESKPVDFPVYIGQQVDVFINQPTG